MKKISRLLFFLLLGFILLLRLFSDHSRNFHYTGDFLAEQSTLSAANNFGKLGIEKTRLLPNYKEVTDPAQETHESLRPYSYSHYPPFPWWFFGGVYLFFGHSILAARGAALLISLLGLFFAFRSVKTVQELVSPEADGAANPTLFAFVFALLAFNSGFLFFSDTIQQQPLVQMLVWASLCWSLRYLFFRASLFWGILLYCLHVWITFEWLVPVGIIFSYCIWKKEESLRKAIKPWLLFAGLGILLPLALRLALNSWALGGADTALQDWVTRAKERSLGDPTQAGMEYQLFKHLGKLFFGLIWFVGIPAILIVLTQGISLLKTLRKKHYLPTLFLLWGVGSVSWQMIMPQNAMVHSYSQLHIANFVFFAAALCLVFFWEKRKGFLAFLMLWFTLEAGMAIKTEIFLPFISQSTGFLSENICKEEAANLDATLKPIKSSISSYIQEELQKKIHIVPCDQYSRRAAQVLTLYSYLVKSRLSLQTFP